MHTKNTEGNLTVDLLKKKVDSYLLQDFSIVIHCMTGVRNPTLRCRVSVSCLCQCEVGLETFNPQIWTSATSSEILLPKVKGSKNTFSHQ